MIASCLFCSTSSSYLDRCFEKPECKSSRPLKSCPEYSFLPLKANFDISVRRESSFCLFPFLSKLWLWHLLPWHLIVISPPLTICISVLIWCAQHWTANLFAAKYARADFLPSRAELMENHSPRTNREGCWQRCRFKAGEVPNGITLSEAG